MVSDIERFMGFLKGFKRFSFRYNLFHVKFSVTVYVLVIPYVNLGYFGLNIVYITSGDYKNTRVYYFQFRDKNEYLPIDINDVYVCIEDIYLSRKVDFDRSELLDVAKDIAFTIAKYYENLGL
ncbi:hypothetical protein SFV1gp61 [Sulfolobus filamentous virus 1]|uniref:Uncharacterized protein n=2 Tax=Alphalipothrixvirus beppuense TaxID=2734584 RepID=A0A346LUA0_SUFV1|nr:hypothetical protein HOT91_gp61 [Sulfolobus filamentous virus 1]AXQ00143.1 hypothetical protein SFV1gp61 [Sulfolobus filamentous virus 1]AZI75763.1 hypothetical protein SBFV1_gp62 [Sulfolobales Beppu filamentous phage 1]